MPRAFRRGAQAVVRHHRALLREALHVLRLLAEEGHRDEEREVRVLRAARLPGDLL